MAGQIQGDQPKEAAPGARSSPRRIQDEKGAGLEEECTRVSLLMVSGWEGWVARKEGGPPRARAAPSPKLR